MAGHKYPWWNIPVLALIFILTFILFTLLFKHWDQLKAFVNGIFS